MQAANQEQCRYVQPVHGDLMRILGGSEIAAKHGPDENLELNGQCCYVKAWFEFLKRHKGKSKINAVLILR